MSVKKFQAILLAVVMLMLTACTTPVLRGTGDLGVIIERATGSVQIVDTSKQVAIAKVTGLGDLSHASLVYSRDGRYAYVFGRDGGLSKVDLLRGVIERRVIQAGNSIGGAISQDGKLLAAQNYVPGGVKIFSTEGKLISVNNNSGKINVSKFPPGVYLVKIETNRSTVNQIKFIKK